MKIESKMYVIVHYPLFNFLRDDYSDYTTQFRSDQEKLSKHYETFIVALTSFAAIHEPTEPQIDTWKKTR